MTATPDQVIAQIREALEKVEVCEWFVDPMPMNNGLTRVDDGKSSGIFPIRGETFEMNYVAAVNPQNIAVLLAELDSLRKAKWDVKHVDTMNDMASLAVALEVAEAENKDLLAELSQSRMEIMGRGEAITILEAERDELLKVLAPFAAEAPCYDPDTGDGDDSVWATPINFKIRDLRRARTLSGDKS